MISINAAYFLVVMGVFFGIGLTGVVGHLVYCYKREKAEQGWDEYVSLVLDDLTATREKLRRYERKRDAKGKFTK